VDIAGVEEQDLAPALLQDDGGMGRGFELIARRELGQYQPAEATLE
jgi:hypothetical protein